MSNAFKILLLHQMKIIKSMLRFPQIFLCNYVMLTMVLSLIYQLWYLPTSSHLSPTAINTAAWALHMTSQFHPLPPLSMSTASWMIMLNLKKQFCTAEGVTDYHDICSYFLTSRSLFMGHSCHYRSTKKCIRPGLFNLSCGRYVLLSIFGLHVRTMI